jgi:hypothetical protein
MEGFQAVNSSGLMEKSFRTYSHVSPMPLLYHSTQDLTVAGSDSYCGVRVAATAAEREEKTKAAFIFLGRVFFSSQDSSYMPEEAGLSNGRNEQEGSKDAEVALGCNLTANGLSDWDEQSQLVWFGGICKHQMWPPC